ncbi:DUF4126 domain-containing protein [Neorhizobium sp. NPDC001467]|uniref:DUF4126 domain-containing protein n=1 Tax=Neorhizobium sp. NPDC001467 TaxID=3390595 RepID=UPI003D0750A3
MIYLLALLIGVVAALRALTAPAAVSWAAYLGWLDLSATWLSFMASAWAVGIFTVLAIGELITDQLPSTPSRKVAPQFGARLVMGALAGAVIGAGSGVWIGGLIAGIIGAAIGTYGGAALRTRLAIGFHRDPPAALVEDAIAIIAAYLIIAALPAGVVTP